jgi:hypothetical protein
VIMMPGITDVLTRYRTLQLLDGLSGFRHEREAGTTSVIDFENARHLTNERAAKKGDGRGVFVAVIPETPKKEGPNPDVPDTPTVPTGPTGPVPGPAPIGPGGTIDVNWGTPPALNIDVNWGNAPNIGMNWGMPPDLTGHMTHDNVEGHMTHDYVQGHLTVDEVTGKLEIEDGKVTMDPISGTVTLEVPTTMPDVKMVYEGPTEIIHKVVGEDITLKYDGPTEFTHNFNGTDFTLNYKGPEEFKLNVDNLEIDIPDLYKHVVEDTDGAEYQRGMADALLYALNKENAVHTIEVYLQEAFGAMEGQPEYISDLAIKTAKTLPKILGDLAEGFNMYRRGGEI